MALLVALAGAMAVASGLWHPRRPAWSLPDIDDGEVLLQGVRQWGDRVIWVDARPRKLYERGHVSGALPLNEDDWDNLLAQLERYHEQRKGHKIVVYCSTRRCDTSHHVAERIRRELGLGRDDVWVLAGGWEAWEAAQR
jgi:rhodanese-related sulfurtransferase